MGYLPPLSLAQISTGTLTLELVESDKPNVVAESRMMLAQLLGVDALLVDTILPGAVVCATIKLRG